MTTTWGVCSWNKYVSYFLFSRQCTFILQQFVKNKIKISICLCLSKWRFITNWKDSRPISTGKISSVGLADFPEKELATHSSILAWRVLWTEQPGGLLSMGSHRVRPDWSDSSSSSSSSRLSHIHQGHCFLPMHGRRQSGRRFRGWHCDVPKTHDSIVDFLLLC